VAAIKTAIVHVHYELFDYGGRIVAFQNAVPLP
jgi:hypothetical protein